MAVEETYSGDYVVVFDPLDGSSNIDAGEAAAAPGGAGEEGWCKGRDCWAPPGASMSPIRAAQHGAPAGLGGTYQAAASCPRRRCLPCLAPGTHPMPALGSFSPLACRHLRGLHLWHLRALPRVLHRGHGRPRGDDEEVRAAKAAAAAGAWGGSSWGGGWDGNSCGGTWCVNSCRGPGGSSSKAWGCNSCGGEVWGSTPWPWAAVRQASAVRWTRGQPQVRCGAGM